MVKQKYSEDLLALRIRRNVGSVDRYNSEDFDKSFDWEAPEHQPKTDPADSDRLVTTYVDPSPCAALLNETPEETAAREAWNKNPSFT